MKQRLGVAAALLGDPELLILDEPANGLDPAGVAVMRDMLRTLGGSGRTVLLSSHLLDEVAQICDRVSILDAGRVVADGTLADVRLACGTGQRIVVKAAPLAEAARLARELPGVAAVTTHADRLELTMDTGQASAVTRALVQAGIAVHELTATGPSLEQAFLQLTGGALAARQSSSSEVSR
jgi:ABC-2 type transport system ATP-binding protein